MKRNDLTFLAINTYGEIVEKTEMYDVYRLREVSDRYDSNFMLLKQMPSEANLNDFITILIEKAKKDNQTHGKFVFPENRAPSEELRAFAEAQGFEWSLLELYSINPTEFKANNYSNQPTISIQYVNEDTLQSYLQMHFEDAVQWGEEYATNIRNFKRKLIQNGQLTVVVALQNGEVIGSTDVIESEHYLEIDHFLVRPSYQKRGIGTMIQQFVMDLAKGKTVILVADGEDTPRAMYAKQGYQYEGFQYAALKSKLF